MASKRGAVDSIQEAIDSFTTGLPELEKLQFNRVYSLLKNLSLDAEGNIKTTIENLKVIGRVKAELSRITDSPEYRNKVSGLQEAITEVSAVQTTYFAKTFEDFTKPKSLEKLQEITFDSTVEQMAGAGMQENVVNMAASIVEDHIAEGKGFFDMVDELKTQMLGNEEVDSKLVSYAKQTINDTLSNFSRNYHNIVTSDLDLEYFEYIGALVDSSRPFCIALVHKHYIHKSELAKIARGDINGVQVSREGLYPGTDGETLINNCGGYNCSHQLIPVPASTVPEDVRKKFETKITPEPDGVSE